jgi:hypothetical protein
MHQCLIYNSSLKFSKATYGILALVAFLIQNQWLVLVISVLIALEIFSIKLSIPYQFHAWFLEKILKKRPEPIQKESAELAFVCGMAGSPLLISFFLLYFDKFVGFAWGLVLVIALLLLLSGIGLCVASLTYVIFKKTLKR